MKKILSCILTLIILVAFAGVSFAKSSNSESKVTIRQAEEAALSFIKRLPEMSNNKNLKAKNAFSMYDISGNEAAFLVEVYNNNELVASVVTGTNTSEYPILEANIGWSPLEASKKFLKKELGNSNRILFTGPLSSLGVS